jgi:hypothetical protein
MKSTAMFNIEITEENGLFGFIITDAEFGNAIISEEPRYFWRYAARDAATNIILLRLCYE